MENISPNSNKENNNEANKEKVSNWISRQLAKLAIVGGSITAFMGAQEYIGEKAWEDINSGDLAKIIAGVAGVISAYYGYEESLKEKFSKQK